MRIEVVKDRDSYLFRFMERPPASVHFPREVVEGLIEFARSPVSMRRGLAVTFSGVVVMVTYNGPGYRLSMTQFRDLMDLLRAGPPQHSVSQRLQALTMQQVSIGQATSAPAAEGRILAPLTPDTPSPPMRAGDRITIESTVTLGPDGEITDGGSYVALPAGPPSGTAPALKYLRDRERRRG